MVNKQETEQIERYIKGLSDDVERARMETLFLNGENNFFLRQSLRNDWENMAEDTSQSEVNLGHLLDKIHHTIHRKETAKRKNPMQKIVRFYMKAAAILLIPLLITGLVYSFLSKNTFSHTDQIINSSIFAPMGSRVSFNLPDGTKGMLNSGSRLSYSYPFTKKRFVNLEGEAWFEVIHDEKYPFTVGTGNSSIKVLGTSFNVSAYPADNYVEVVLQNGKVEFEDNINKQTVSMIPSERLVFNNGSLIKSHADPSKYTAWTEGKLIFRGDSMSQVAHRIERWYNVKVILVGKELEKYSFRGTFEDDSLDSVLHFLSMTSPISYKITPRILMQDGTYSKEEVTIFMK